YVGLGTGDVETYRPADFGAFFRRARGRLAKAVASGADTYPYPVTHCGLCDFFELCEKRWEDDDHLSQVAWIRHDQIERLNATGIGTLERLGETAPGTVVDHMAPDTFERLRHQAALQLSARLSGAHRYDLLEPQEKRGLGLLPPPDAGDLFYDIEGDPFWEPGRSLEYLHGMGDTSGSVTALWAHDRESEEPELEGGEDSIVVYEQWVADRDPALLELIERYNEEDVVSNLRLRDWLLERKAEAERTFGDPIAWREPPEVRVPKEETAALLGERA